MTLPRPARSLHKSTLHKSTALMFAIAVSAFSADFTWNIPAGFPKPAVPAENPMSAAKIELGRRLFYDKRMSVNGKESCASCHRQELAFTDGKAHAEGTTGQLHPRSAMSLVNVAYAPVLTWANPKLDSLEDQALGPMLGEQPIELGLKGRETEFLTILRNDALYRGLFAKAFESEDAVTLRNVTLALAAFERSIVSMRSPYDRYRWGGEQMAISNAAKRGEIIFSSSEKGRCFQCHGGWNFSAIQYEGSRGRGDEDPAGVFFNTGVSSYSMPNRGLFEYTQRAEDVGKFRVPTLRNIAVTAPYMHDGSIATLAEVVDHYAAGGRMPHANQSTILRPLTLTDTEKQDLIEFLKSLTDTELLHDPRWNDPWVPGK